MTYDTDLLLGILDRADSAIWIYDTDNKRIHWANQAAVEMWDARSLDELRARDMSTDMSYSVDLRLRQYQEDFIARDAEFYESWTLYPQGKPRPLRVKYSGVRLEDGRMAMLCQAVDAERSAPEAIRSIEALLHATVMVSMFTLDGRMLYCNPAARACYGTNGKLFRDRFTVAEDYLQFAEQIERAGSGQITARVQTAGGEVWHQIRGVRCNDAVTGEAAILISESDVTEVQEARAALEVSRNQALEANRLKSEFLANMSHEIRTPLNGVLGMAQLLKRTDLTARQAQMMDIILASGETLLALISDILDISRIEAGLVQIEEEAFDVEALMDATVASVQGAAFLKGLTLSTRSEFDKGARMIGDANLIRQVLVNLTGNAIKFSNEGTVRIAAEPGSGGTVRFSVSDQGPGIEPDQQALIFDRFRQGDQSDTRRHGGTGLGLSIAKHLVEMMGGRIGVESVPGMGAEFWFALPLAAAPEDAERRIPAPAPDPPKPISAPPGEAPRILVVEDNRANRTIASEALEMAGYETVAVETGAAALEILERETLDLVLLDLHMPGMPGTRLLWHIRSSAKPYRDLPVVIMTADVTPSARAKALDAGASAFLTKPLAIDSMMRVIGEALEQFGPKQAQG